MSQPPPPVPEYDQGILIHQSEHHFWGVSEEEQVTVNLSKIAEIIISVVHAAHGNILPALGFLNPTTTGKVTVYESTVLKLNQVSNSYTRNKPWYVWCLKTVSADSTSGWCLPWFSSTTKVDVKVFLHIEQDDDGKTEEPTKNRIRKFFANGIQALFVKKDAKEAVQHLTAAAELGKDHESGGPAQYRLGMCFETGQGVEQSDEKALHYYQLAKNKGFHEAELRLAVYAVMKKNNEDEFLNTCKNLILYPETEVQAQHMMDMYEQYKKTTKKPKAKLAHA